MSVRTSALRLLPKFGNIFGGGQTDQNPAYFCRSTHFVASQHPRTVSMLQTRCFWKNSKVFSDLQ